jgi:microcystin-dependent protein
MVEPVTAQKTLIVPNTGDLSGAWGTSALNPNFQTVDALFGGVTTITLSVTTTLLLSVPATTGIWPGSLSQSVNSLIKFTGAQTGSAVIQFTLPGYYIVHNQCTGTTFVQLAPSVGVGNRIGAPPGQKIHVFYDGTDMDYVNMPTPGSALDLHTNTTTLPPWMTACTVAPYLIKNGAIYTASVYPALAQLLGSTYGGNGITTFGVPDELSRVRLPVDTGATGRVTSLSGINGSTLGASGGSQLMQSHNHTATVTDPGHVHFIPTNNPSSVASLIAGSNAASVGGTNSNSAVTGITVGVNGTGSGTSQNMPPAIVDFLPLVKT